MAHREFHYSSFTLDSGDLSVIRDIFMEVIGDEKVVDFEMTKLKAKVAEARIKES